MVVINIATVTLWMLEADPVGVDVSVPLGVESVVSVVVVVVASVPVLVVSGVGVGVSIPKYCHI